MLEQINNSLKFHAFYLSSKTGKTGLTVTVDVYHPNHSSIVTGASASAIGGGAYAYRLASAYASAEGEYLAIFKTSDTSVDQQHIPSLYVVGKAGIENLNATISSRSTLTSSDVWNFDINNNGPYSDGIAAQYLEDISGSQGTQIVLMNTLPQLTWAYAASSQTDVNKMGGRLYRNLTTATSALSTLTTAQVWSYDYGSGALSLIIDNINNLVTNYLDATISTRASATHYTPTRAAKLDFLDASILSRLATSAFVYNTISASAIAIEVLTRPLSGVESSASFRSLAGAVAKLVNRIQTAGGILKIYQTDDTTILGQQTLTTDASAVPIIEADTQ